MRRRQVYAARAAAEMAASVPQQPEAALLSWQDKRLEEIMRPHHDDAACEVVTYGEPHAEPVQQKARKKPGPKPGSKRKH